MKTKFLLAPALLAAGAATALLAADNIPDTRPSPLPSAALSPTPRARKLVSPPHGALPTASPSPARSPKVPVMPKTMPSSAPHMDMGGQGANTESSGL